MTEVLIFAAIVIATVVFLKWGKIKNYFFPAQQKNLNIDDRFNAEKRSREQEIDHLLGKMGKNGTADLSEKDRKRLDELSRK